MTERPADSERQSVEDVLPPELDDLAIPIELSDLQPWHRPRKQYVRERQWVRFAEQLIKREKGTPSLRADEDDLPEVRYLTLPGIDYLDVRLIAEACSQHGCKLTATGLLGNNQPKPYIARANIREQALIDSGHISDQSFTRPSRFEDLADQGSQAHLDIQSKGPFHIVNVDACGSLAPPAGRRTRRLIDAIHKLIMFQLEHKTGSWLLFLTTDARPESVDQETVQRLWCYVEANAEENDSFRSAVISLFELGHEADIAAAPALVNLPGAPFLKLFSLGLGKWLLHLANPYNYGVRTHPAYCYSTAGDGKTPTMASLAFEFARHPPRHSDRFCVVRADPHRTRPDDETPSDSVRVATKVREMANLDTKMNDDQLRQRMLENTRALLEEAGYPAGVLSGLGR